MPNTVLGKVSCVPRGDYSASETYYALDIVGYQGGSYLAMKEVTGVTPSNDGVNWMQLSGPGLPGADGVTFTPSVSEAGEISWTNNGEKENPEPVDIMGPPGAAAGFGTVTATADNTSSETPSVDVQASGPDTAKNFAFAFSGLKGNPGETPDITIGTVTTLEPGQDATAEITGTTPDLVLSLGLPKGQPGTSVSRIQRTDGTGAAGTTDTYTMYDSDGGEIGTFTVYNGSNGTGSGDFMANGTVPMTGALNMGGNRVTNVGAPTASTDAVRQSDLQAVSDEVDHILDGTTPAYIPAATETKVGGIKPGTGLEVESDGTANVTLTGVPSGGTTGQILTQGASGPEWEDAPDTGVTKFNGRTGAVTPQDGDYTAGMVGARPDTWTPSAADVGAVPTSRTVNGQGLSQDINLTADNVGARPSTWTPTASDVGAIPNPSGGTTGQILEKTATGTQWADKPSSGISQSEADARYLQLSGGTMTGALALPGNPTSDNQAANKAYVDSLKPTRLTAVLSASGWSGNAQTITVNGVITNTSAQDIDISCADKASADAWAAGGVWCSNPTKANKLTFTCTTPPTANINLNIRLWEVG